LSVVNLNDVTFIDEDGERLLSDMRSAGVDFVATGVDTKHLLRNLKSRGERPLRRSIKCFTGVAKLCCSGDSVRSLPAAARPRRRKEV
jgi:hypothetical protein